MIDWTSIVISVTSTTAVVGTLSFIAKKSFEKLLDNKFKQAQEDHKAELAEAHRREAQLFDQRFDALKTAVSLVYRARNAARSISSAPETRHPVERTAEEEQPKQRNPAKALRAYHEAIEELLFEERGIMPIVAFDMLHEQKHNIYRILDLLRKVEYFSARHTSEGASLGREGLDEEVRRAFAALDHGYEGFVRISQQFMGVTRGEG